MRLVIRNARVIIDGVPTHVDVIVEDGKILSVERNYSGPYDESFDAEGSFVIPGLLEPLSLIRGPEEAEALLRAGITQALVFLPGKRSEFLQSSKELSRHSLIDLGFRSNDVSVTPWESFGHIVSSERELRLLWEAYGESLVGIIGLDKQISKRLIRKALAYGHDVYLLSPRFPFVDLTFSCVALNVENVLRGERQLRLEAFEVINRRRSKYLLTYGRFSRVSASLMLSLVLRGFSSWQFLNRFYESMRSAGFRIGLNPGDRANLVILRKKIHEFRGVKLYFDTRAVFVGGRLVMLDGEIIERPKIMIINHPRGLIVT